MEVSRKQKMETILDLLVQSSKNRPPESHYSLEYYFRNKHIKTLEKCYENYGTFTDADERLDNDYKNALRNLDAGTYSDGSEENSEESS